DVRNRLDADALYFHSDRRLSKATPASTSDRPMRKRRTRRFLDCIFRSDRGTSARNLRTRPGTRAGLKTPCVSRDCRAIEVGIDWHGHFGPAAGMDCRAFHPGALADALKGRSLAFMSYERHMSIL